MIPLAAWIALSGMPWLAVCAIIAWEWISSGFYIGDIWKRHYGALWRDNVDVREIGEYLRNEEGRLWVNDYHPGVYIYARKKCDWFLTEQAEMNTVLTERREKMSKLFTERPPDIIVQGKKCGAKFDPRGYKLVAKHRDGSYQVYRRYA